MPLFLFVQQLIFQGGSLLQARDYKNTALPGALCSRSATTCGSRLHDALEPRAALLFNLAEFSDRSKSSKRSADFSV